MYRECLLLADLHSVRGCEQGEAGLVGELCHSAEPGAGIVTAASVCV